MNNPFATLELTPGAGVEEIRAAYRSLVKVCHPDMVQDPEAKKQAQERMVQLNLAYEEALRLAAPHPSASLMEGVCLADALQMANKMLSRGNPESALRQLLRAEEKDARWYAMQGKILLAMEQFDTAHQSFREAVRLDPENNEYRTGALEAAVAMKKQKTIGGKLKKFWKGVHR